MHKYNKATTRYKDVPNNETYMSMETFIQCLKSVPSYVDIHFTGYVESFLNPKDSLLSKFNFLRYFLIISLSVIDFSLENLFII